MGSERSLSFQSFDPFTVLYNYSHTHQHCAASAPDVLKDDAARAAPAANSPNSFVATNATRRQSMPYVVGNARLDNDLRVMDFLIGSSLSHPGGTGSYMVPSASNSQLNSSLVDGALQILDESFSNTCREKLPLGDRLSANVRAHNDSNHQPRSKTSGTGISRLISPNGRIAYLVSKGTSNTKKKYSSLSSKDTPVGTEQPQDKYSSCYLCMLPDEMALPGDFSSLLLSQGPFATKLQSPDTVERPTCQPLQLYCSCRSFFELSCRKTNDCRNDRDSDHNDLRMVLCKHLLAIRLLPYFLHSEGDTVKEPIDHLDHIMHISTMKFVSEEDFSRAILQRVLH
jgi:hypothetical protein